MGGKVVVGCKLPVGFNPQFEDGTVFAGTNQRGSEYTGGYGITENVDADAYGEWEKRMRAGQFEPVLKGLIFAEKDADSAKAMAREFAGLTSGFEQIDPENKATGVQPDADTLRTGEPEQKAIAAKAEGKG